MKKGVLAWVVCLSAALFFAYELMQLHLLNAIAPMLMRDLKLGGIELGYLGSTYLLADVIFLLPAGMILDRFSVRRVIITALLVCILGTVGFAFSQNLLQAGLCHFLSGIGNAFCFLSCMILVSRWFPSGKQAFVVGIVVTVGMVGGVVAQSPFSMLAEALTWRNALLVDALIGVFILGLIYRFVREPKVVENVSNSQNVGFFDGLKAALTNRQNVLCGLYTSLMNMPLMIIGAVWGSLFLTQVHGLTLASASFVVSMICMGTIFGSPFFGYLSDKIGKRRPLMIVGGVLSLVVYGSIILVNSPGMFQLLTLFFLLGFFTSTQIIGYPTISESNPRHMTGTSMGVAAVIIMGLAGALQPLSGFLMDLHWDGTMVDGAPLYAYENFFTAFSIFPIGFVLALISVFLIRETYCKELKLDI